MNLTKADTLLSSESHTPNDVDTIAPIKTLVDFFDDFHLQDARQELRQLCQLALTSDNRLYDTGLKRSNLMYFCEKMDQLLTACNSIAQRQEAFRKFVQHPGHGDDETDEDDKPDKENCTNEEHFTHTADNANEDQQEQADPAMPINRPELYLEFLPHNPEYLLAEVFTSNHLYDFREDHLPKWLRAALTNGNSAYNEGEERMALMRLYDALLPLIEALHIINEQNKLRAGSHHMPMHPDIAKYNAPKFLEEAEQNNPMIVVRRFCRQFSLVYLRRELHCFVHAAVAMQQNYPEHFSPSVALRVYDEVLALVEAAYVLSAEED